jgi:hypothetical protein
MDMVKIGKDFFESINNMDREELFSLINNEIGEDMINFLQNYASMVASKTEDIDILKKNLSSMLILGYLLRTRIDREKTNEAIREH